MAQALAHAAQTLGAVRAVLSSEGPATKEAERKKNRGSFVMGRNSSMLGGDNTLHAYRRQLVETPLTPSDRDVIVRLHHKKQMHMRMDSIDDFIAALSICAVVTAGVITQLTYLNFADTDYRDTGRLPEGFRDTGYVTFFKCIASSVALLMCGLLCVRVHFQHHMDIVAYKHAKRSTPCPWLCPFTCSDQDQRCAMLRGGRCAFCLRGRYCYCTRLGWASAIEMCVLSTYLLLLLHRVDVTFELKFITTTLLF